MMPRPKNRTECLSCETKFAKGRWMFDFCPVCKGTDLISLDKESTNWHVAFMQKDGSGQMRTWHKTLVLGEKATKQDAIEALKRQNDVHNAEIINVEKIDRRVSV